MKGQAQAQAIYRKKVAAIGALFAISVALMFLGLGFTAVNLMRGTEFAVLGTRIPGAAFGAVIAFLGARYFLSVMRLKNEVFKTESRFSWGNFRRK